MPYAKGGRGHNSPYGETTHVRVPVAIKPKVQQIIDEYRSSVIDNTFVELEKHSKISIGTAIANYSEAIEIAKKIVKQKKSASDSLAMLLTALYGGKVTKEDLK